MLLIREKMLYCFGELTHIPEIKRSKNNYVLFKRTFSFLRALEGSTVQEKV
jgi:hypothetical protein